LVDSTAHHVLPIATIVSPSNRRHVRADSDAATRRGKQGRYSFGPLAAVWLNGEHAELDKMVDPPLHANGLNIKTMRHPVVGQPCPIASRSEQPRTELTLKGRGESGFSRCDK